MGIETNSTSGGEMNEESIKYALVGLKAYLARHNIKQKAFSAGVTTPEHFSKIINFKAGASDEMIRRLASKAGLETAELVLLGKQSDEKQPYTPLQEQVVPGQLANHVEPIEVLSFLTMATSAVSTLVGQYQKNDERMRFWRAIFDNLPIATLIIKDGLVCYQNIKSRAWGNITGTSLCDTCIGAGCESKENCPIHIAIETVAATSGYQQAGEVCYKVDTVPLRIGEHDYFIVTATEAVESDNFGRRNGGDRRKLQGE